MSEKRRQRLEAKKRKAAAFLHIAKLNDEDKRGTSEAASDVRNGRREESQSKKAKHQNASANDKPKLSGGDYETLRAELRARKKALAYLPRFGLKASGHDASIEVPEKLRTPLFLAELQALLAYCMIGDKVPYEPFSWCKLDKWNRLVHVLCLVVEGLSVKDVANNRHEEEVARIERVFPDCKLEFVSPASYGSTATIDFSVLPVGARFRKSMVHNFGSILEALQQGAAIKRQRALFPVRKVREREAKAKAEEKAEEDEKVLKLRLMMGPRQMVAENYPLPLPGPMAERFDSYVMTKQTYDAVHLDSPLFSVDCEMCYTTNGLNELTRVCVVDEEGAVVYHSLVKPKAKIVNYLTRYSGITPDMLDGVETMLEDVQKELQRVLPADAILVGHSLNSDLHALRMMHPYVIDTSVIYNLTGARMRKNKLSLLAAKFLGQNIQEQDEGKGKLGHDPVEDAQAAMKLVKLKLEKGYEFGDVILDGGTSLAASIDAPLEGDGQQDEDKKIIQEANDGDSTVLATTMLNQMKEAGKTMSVVCQRLDTAEEYKALPGYPGLVRAPEGGMKATVNEAASLAVNHNLLVCHTKVKEGCDIVTKVRQKIRTCTENVFNGAFLSVCTDC